MPLLVMGPGQKFLTLVGSIFVVRVSLGQVSHLWLGFGFGKFPLKISSGQVKKYLGQRRVGLLYTASQKYARVG